MPADIYFEIVYVMIVSFGSSFNPVPDNEFTKKGHAPIM